ncbi:MAG TPA: alpha/beta hydrolase [Egibacteraceae bacterium]|nr:alpha/beta hydrolase [Egibacteraceae bacterium]
MTPRRAVRTAACLLGPVGLAAGAGLAWVAVRSRPVPPERRHPEPPPGLPPGRIVHVPGRGEFFVREAAPDNPNAPTVVLLHGWMFSADLTWFTCYDELARFARVIAADHRGHGRGTRPTEPFRLVDVADDVAALLHHLDATPAVAVGYSMGGTIAQLLWQRHPDVVSGLVLAATSATFNDARDRWTWRAMGILQLILRLLPRDVWEKAAVAQAKSRSNMRLSRLIHPDTPAEVMELLPWMTGELSRNSAEDVAEAGRELGRFDTRGWLASIDVPTAVLILTRDGLVPLDNQRDLAARIPHCHTQELPLDHDGVVARPDVFLPALIKGLQQVLDA